MNYSPQTETQSRGGAQRLVRARWRIINRPKLKAQFQFEPRDVWVGLFWRVNREMPPPFYTMHIYVCILPLIPLHVTVLLRSNESS